MIARPARVALVGLLLVMFGPGLTASRPHPVEVDEKIDRITAPPEYDWLRQKGDAAGAPARGANTKGKPSDVSGRTAEEGGCDFSPSIAASPLAEDEPSCQRGRSDCDTSPVGACDCGAPVGGCSGAGVGALSPVGYLVIGGALCVILALGVSALLGRRVREPDAASAAEEGFDSPESIRPSSIPSFSVASLMARGRDAAERGDFKSAVGFAYLAGLDHLHRAGVLDLRRSTTNLEVASAAARVKGLKAPTTALLRVFEELFFGGRHPTPTHWETCRQIVEEAFGETGDNN